MGVRQRTLKKKKNRFRLEQRMNYPITGESYEAILSLIARFLGPQGKNQRRQYQTGKSCCSAGAASTKSLQVLVERLDVQPLRSSKYIDYQDWRKAALLVIEGSQYTGGNRGAKK